MPLQAYACVIGNPSGGQDHRSDVAVDVERVAGYLRPRGVILTNEGQTVGLTAQEMAEAFARFVEALANAPQIMAIFYYCGHAIERRRPKDILLLGQDAPHPTRQAPSHSLSLLDSLKQLANVPGLKLVIIDGCRIPEDADGDAGLWESFEDAHWDLLHTIPDLFIVTASSSGKQAYQGKFTKAFIEQAEAIGTDTDELTMPLEGWLRNVLGKISKQQKLIQRPSFFSYMRTQEWIIGDLTKGGREASMPTKEEQLAAALRELDETIDEVRKKNNGIQFIMTAFCGSHWETPRPTEYLAEDHGPPKRNLLDGPTNAKVWRLAQTTALNAFTTMKKEGKHAEADAVVCSDLPDDYGTFMYYRWHCEPNKSFIFLAGGVGPKAKADQFHQFSHSELDKDGQLSKALADYAKAFAEYHAGK